MDAGYRVRGKEWAEQALGAKVEEVVNCSLKPLPEKVLRVFWAKEWFRYGREINLSKLLSKRAGFEKLLRRWVAERTFAWILPNRRIAKYYERLCSASESFVSSP